MEKISAEEFKKRYGSKGLELFKQPEKKLGFVDRIKESAKAGVEKIKSGVKDVTRQGAPISQAPTDLLRGIGKMGAGAVETVFSPVTAAAEPVIKPTIGKAINYAADKISDIPAVQRFATSEAGERTSRVVEDVANYNTIVGALVGSKAAPKVGKAIAETTSKIGTKGSDAFSAVVENAPKAVSKIKEVLEPPAPSPKQAMGQILQGKPADVKAGFKGLKAVETEGVKTYSDLQNKIQGTIKKLSEKVDETLGKDKKSYQLSELELVGKTKQGQALKVDYVNRALQHLEELYKSIGDDIASKDMADLIQVAKTKGLSRKQVNDLSRIYGQEFGEKAFGKTGEPLTSINAQKFENTRTGLKSVARKGLGGATAKATDETISNLYRVQKLVKQNAEAVNKLAQKIQERGFLEKFGYKAAKAVDILTGGSLRGIVGGLLPRGVGYKVMNALDLENVLQRNLGIIKKALESGNDSELLKIINNITKKP